MNDILYTRNTFDREVEDTINKIKAAVSKDSLIMPVFTDLHTSGLEGNTFNLLLQGLEVISSRVTLDAVISLGDNLSMLGRNIHASNVMIKELLTGIFDRVSDITKVPCYHVNGNHDGIGTDFFNVELWHSIVGEKYDYGMAHRDGNSAYFYVDYEEQGVRMIFLSVPCDSDIEARHPTPLWKFGEQQLKWLSGTALKTAQPRDILLFCHVPFYYRYSGDITAKLSVWKGDKEAESYISALCGWIDDRDNAEKIIRMYHINNKSSRIVACISGHMHVDSLLVSGEKTYNGQNNLICPQIEISSVDILNNSLLKENAELGIAFDVLVITPSERRLSLIRFGDGQDREISY